MVKTTRRAARPPKRGGFTRTELLVVVTILVILIALVLSGILGAREAARRTSCKSHLKQWILAMHNFHSVYGAFPHGDYARTDDDGFCCSESVCSSALKPYMDAGIGDLSRIPPFDWRKWTQDYSTEPFRPSICPSADNGPVCYIAWWGPNGEDLPSAGLYATMNYAFCQGSVGQWCIDFDEADEAGGYLPPYNGDGGSDVLPPPVPTKKGYSSPPSNTWEGLMNRGRAHAISEITDGTSNTFAIGEAAGGDNWPLCRGVGCTDQYAFTDPDTGAPFPANTGWAVGQPGDEVASDAGFLTSSQFGCTEEPLNKNPVTDSWMAQGDDPRLVQRDCSQSAGHTTSNFRSDHPGGGQFALADGSVRFINEDIQMKTYQALSTIAGGETIGTY